MRLTSALLFFLPLFCATSCSTCSGNLGEKMQYAIDSAQAVLKGEMMRDSLREVRKAELIAEIDSLQLLYYNYNGNSFGSSVLVHNTWNVNLDLDRNGLMVVVFGELGEIGLVSTLPEIHAKRHNRVKIEIADQLFDIDSAFSYPINEPGNNGEILYVTDERAFPFVEYIAANPTAEVKVSAYYNDTLYTSYALSNKDKSAIIASYKLCLLLLELEKIQAQDVEWDD